MRSFLAAHGISTSVRGEALRKTHALRCSMVSATWKFWSAAEEAEEARNLLDQAERGEFALEDSQDP